MIHQNPSCGVPQLKDVLQDPDASWSQIREAMKSSSGGCTNAAIVGALASRAGDGAVALSPDDDNIETKSVIKASTVNSNNNNTAVVVKDGIDTVSPLRAASFSETMTNDAASVPSENTTQDVPDDKTNSQNRRPARRSLRRRNSGLHGSRTSSFRMSRQGSGKRGLLVGTHSNSSFRSQMSDSSKKSEASSKNKGEWAPAQLGSINASVNMMDFGIDHTRQIIEGGMDTLSETHSLEDGMSANSGRRRGSSICSSFSGSFLGWNNDDDSTSELFSSGVLHSSLSHLVDSSGFLDWDHRTKDTPPVSPLRKSQNGSSKKKVEVTDEIASDLSRHISHAMSGDGDFLCSSFHSNSSTSPKGEKGEEEWNIEDYENPLEDNAVRNKPLRGGSFFRNQFNSMRRCSQEKEATNTSSTTVNGEKKEGINMNDIKEALFKVANEKKPNDGNNASKVKPRRRRQTVVGMNPFLGSESKAGSDVSKSPTTDRRATLTSLPGISQFLLSTERSPDNKPPAVSALSQMSETDDNRTAIWINKTDGGFDIDEERRKLYEEQDNKNEPQKKGGFFRRGSVERNG